MKIATVRLLLDVKSDAEAADAVNELLREEQRDFAPASCLIDYAQEPHFADYEPPAEYQEGEAFGTPLDAASLSDRVRRLEDALLKIAAGSEMTGRWLDPDGTECGAEDPGAMWHEYDETEQTEWIASVASLANRALEVERAEGGKAVLLNNPLWTNQDAEDSIAQGLSIFAVDGRGPEDEARLGEDGRPYGHRPFELMFVQDPPDGKEPIFASDDEAWAFVRAQADAGDTLGLKAKAFLSAHSPREYEAIFGDETGGAPSPASGQCRNCMGFGWEPAVYEGKRPCGHCGPTQEVYGCPNCDWCGEGAVPARDVLARHAPGDVFSDLECPECGALVHPVSAEPDSDTRLVAILIYEHQHGRDVSAYGSYAGAKAALAEIARSQWKDRAATDVLDDPDGLSDDEVIRLYFDGHDEEFYDIEQIDVDFKD